jgi:hypothetical protein
VLEYGNAIKELVAANIFPGDMLYKNFGVTRHGRVVFYDYDEIEYITDCNFRDIPAPRNEEDEMASEPWYSVGKHDVFPEQFGHFLLGDPKIRNFSSSTMPTADARAGGSRASSASWTGKSRTCSRIRSTSAFIESNRHTTPAWRHRYRRRIHTIWRPCTMNDPVVIVGAARTPMGAFQGDFSSKSASDLGAVAIKAAVERAGVDASLVEHVYFGNCLMAGQGQAPARQALIKAGLPLSTGAVTLSKMCGSAMQAAIFAHDSPESRQRRRGRRGRHGVDDQRALPDPEGARRLPHRPRHDVRPHDAGRPGRRLLAQRKDRRRPLDGHLRRRVRGEVLLHARSAGRLRDRIGQARPGRHRRIRRLRHGKSPR